MDCLKLEDQCSGGLRCRSCSTCRWYLETDKARVQRAQRKREKELRALADKILAYGRTVHQCYPTGDVVVSEGDLAERDRKSTRLNSSHSQISYAVFCLK